MELYHLKIGINFAKGIQLIYDHFKRFGLEMHIRERSEIIQDGVCIFSAAGILQTQVDINSNGEWCDQGDSGEDKDSTRVAR